ncbi:MAG: phosphatidylglycerophosphatase A [Campylobacterales bacterium]|nr:phosphatidylglycerophosphatase A [Campylobacterales bacterium]
MREFFLTVGYSGLSPKAPGTVGSLVSLVLAMLLLHIISVETLFMLSLLISVIGAKQIDLYELETNTHDSSKIVIDELAGMWITLSVAGVLANDYVAAIIAFVFFRLFDIFKPSIIGKIDRDVPRGWGVMGDDMVAGIFAGLCTTLVFSGVTK